MQQEVTLQGKRNSAQQRAAIASLSQDDGRIVDEVKRRVKNARRAKIDLERQWMYNLRFTLGDQWTTIDVRGFTQRIYERKRSRQTRNFFRPFVERRIAALTNPQPLHRVRPNSQEIEDIRSSEAGEKIVRHFRYRLDVQELRQELAFWTVVTGNSFEMQLWNPRGGDSFPGPEVIQTGENQYAAVPNTERLYYNGDMEFTNVSPFAALLPPKAKCWRDVGWFAVDEQRPRQWFEQNWPDKAHLITYGKHTDEPLRVEYNDLVSMMRDTEEDEDDQWAQAVIMFERPTEFFPRGRLIVLGGDTLLFNDANPTPKGRIPIVHRTDMLTGGIWGQSNLDNLISPQRSYNRQRSRKQEYVDLFGNNLKILASGRCDLEDFEITNQIGQIIHYTGDEPRYLAPPPMPAESELMMNLDKQDFDTITSTYGPERGQYQGRSSGKAIDLLVEQAQVVKQPLAQRMAIAEMQWGQNVLEWFQAYSSDELKVSVVGKDNAFDVEFFNAADIAGNTDVYVEMGSMLPKSRTMVLSELAAKAQIGLFNPMDSNDRVRALKALGEEDSEAYLRDKKVHLRVAQLEDAAIMRGQPVPDATWDDDHDIHAAQHRATKQTDQYRSLPPQVKALMEMHQLSHSRAAFPQPGVTMDPQMLQAGQEPDVAEGG